MAITNLQTSDQPLKVPNIDIQNSGSDDVSAGTAYPTETVKTVQIGEGFTQVQLPNGFPYNAGDEVELTQWEFDQISTAAFSSGVVTDITE